MRTSDLANEKYKNVHDNLSNIAILTKSVTSGEVQLTKDLCALHHREIVRGGIQQWGRGQK